MLTRLALLAARRITPTTILALSPLILLAVFLGSVIFTIPGWQGQ